MPNILVIGEALVDCFNDGNVIGGAPLNLARNLAGLGAGVDFISRVGDDTLGKLVLADAAACGLITTQIQIDPAHPTGSVQVEVSANGQPSYAVASPSAWDFINAPAPSRRPMTSHTTAASPRTSPRPAPQHLAPCELICFNTLTLRHSVSRDAVWTCLSAQPQAKRFVDINLRSTGPSDAVVESVLHAADWLKLNDEELSALSQRFNLPAQPLAAVQALHQQFGISQTVLTRGALGAQLYVSTQCGSTCQMQASAPAGAMTTTLVDTVGAGDGFSAAWLAAWAAGLPKQAALTFACEYAAALCTHRGPLPALGARAKFFSLWRAQLDALGKATAIA